MSIFPTRFGVTCDYSTCSNAAEVLAATEREAREKLPEHGWEVTKEDGYTYCPEHAALPGGAA